MPDAARPGPSELWQQAGGDGERYRQLLRQHGHLLSPGDEGYEEGRAGLPCGWPGKGGDRAGHVAPARYALTVLHRRDPDSGPGTDGEGDPTTGLTVCGLPMGESELWQPVEARDGDPLCPGCENPGAAPAADIQEALL